MVTSQNITASSLILIIIFLVEIYIADGQTNKKQSLDSSCSSPPCSCCLETANCSDSGRCGGQCKAGYFGGKCLNKCPDKCVLCTDHPKSHYKNGSSYWSKGYCTECKDGFYSTEELYQCQSACREGCARCSSNNHCDGCKPGYFISTDTCLKCESSCATCTSSINCITCVDGYFLNGNICQPCRVGCARCSSNNVCNQCKPGYYSSGTHCLACSMGCSNQCDNTTGTCICKAEYTGSSCDSCVSGWYYSTGTCQVCLSSCATCTSFISCTSCDEGYFLNGNNCQSCAKACARCSSYNYCDQCKPGYYISGTDCLACSSGCNAGQCDVTSGSCTCKPGYEGNMCDHCAPKYKPFPYCDQCVSGYFGSSCNQNCPENCHQSECKKENGTCTQGCIKDFMGENCTDCSRGWFGPDCADKCPENCDGGCDRSSGSCQTCQPNFSGTKCQSCTVSKYGTSCNFTCSAGCKAACDKHSGYCDSCIDGRYGNKCELNCSVHCLSGTCNIENGTCDEGCKSGYSGDKCCLNGPNCKECSAFMDCKDCNDGFYGKNCSQNCSTHCTGSKCDINNGTCGGCVDGYQGDLCEEFLSVKNEDKGNEEGVPVTLIAVSVAVSVAVGIVLLIVFLKRRSNSDLDHVMVKFTSEEDHENELDIIDGGDYVDIVSVEPEPTIIFSDGAVYAVSGKTKKKMTKDTATADVTTNKITTKDVPTDDVQATKKTTKDTIKADLPTMKTPRKNIAKADLPTMKTSRKDIANAVVPSIEMSIKDLATAEVPAIKVYREDIDTANSPTIETSRKDIATADVPSSKNTTEEIPTVNAPDVFHASVHQENVSELESDYYNTYYDGNRGIAVNNLASFVERIDEGFFIDEFQKLPKGLIKATDEAEKPHNLKKNRFNAIYPYDETRVILEEPGSDFINACYIEGFRKRREYIASFGPIAKATEGFSTFWRMVWQERTEKIVMVTNLRENGGKKCEKYWPDVNVTILYGDVSVTGHSADVYAEYNVRSFTVKKGNEERSLHHIHYTAWPDKGVPDDVTSMIEFRSKVNATKVTLGGPIIVHCSAGVGRTGTYIALDILTLQGQKTGQVDIFDCVEKLRQQRTIMVQTAEQYEYVYRALVHSLTLGSEAILAEQFRNYMSYLSRDEINTKFEMLTHLKEKVSADEHEAVKRNTTLKHLSRAGSDIPGDNNRPRLYQGMTAEENSFINAVFVNSFKVKNQFIMTQTPLPTTVNDFLTLIVQEKCSCIVSMDPVGLSDESIGTYMPADNQVLRTESFEVKGVMDESNNSYTLRTLTVTATSTNVMQTASTHTVKHFQCSHWPEMSKTPKSTDHFLQLVNEVQSTAEAAPSFSPVLVHCRTGSERSGLLCVVVSLLQKMEIEHEVSVINTVRQVKLRRPGAIPDTEQFSFCHDCVSKYLEAFDIYSNFT